MGMFSKKQQFEDGWTPRGAGEFVQQAATVRRSGMPVLCITLPWESRFCLIRDIESAGGWKFVGGFESTDSVSTGGYSHREVRVLMADFERR